VWVRRMEARDVRNIREAELDLAPGLNVFFGRNAQGKTTLLEAVGLLARGRSFRTDETPTLIRRGAEGLTTRGIAVDGSAREIALEVEVGPSSRALRVDGRSVPPRSYQGRLEVVVYSTERLKVIRGPMRERRAYLDRSASALWPAYRQEVRDYERVLGQRNASLEAGGRDQGAWDECFGEIGARLRLRRAGYARRLGQALEGGYPPAGESYGIALAGGGEARTEAEERAALAGQMDDRRRDEQRSRRSLVGPHCDVVQFLINGEDAVLTASSGQARSLLLALTLATLAVYREERGTPAVALLDDLDSELDEERAVRLCRDVAGRGQALITTAHTAWARTLAGMGRAFHVAEGQVTTLGVS
jgi:DNA replication and repair protein RecF